MSSRLSLLFALVLTLLAAPGLAAGPQEARLSPAFGDDELGLDAALAIFPDMMLGEDGMEVEF